MTFTQFLRRPNDNFNTPSFLQLARHDELWPAQSNRLEDFEAFLTIRLEEECEGAIAELRAVWRVFADENQPKGAKHDLDLALAAWRDYAAHFRTCTRSASDRCQVAAELMERALEESRFDDSYLSRRPPVCEGAEEIEEDEVRFDDDDEEFGAGDDALGE